MHRAPLLAVPFVLVVAAAAFADEYTVAPASGLWAEPPSLATSDMTPAVAAQHSTEVIGKNLDGVTESATLPFPFPFFGTIYNSISVADDGWIAFGSTTVIVNENPVLPLKTAPNAVVAALWDDLRTTKRDSAKKGQPKKGAVVRFTQGTAPNRTFVIAWQHMDTVAQSSSADMSFEVLLHEGTGVVDIAYAPGGDWNGLSFTAGIENETGTRAFGGPNLGNENAGKPSADQRFTPHGVPISGTITRDRPIASATGLGPARELDLPVRGVRVEVTREDAATRTVVASALTDATGLFTATVLGVDGAPSVAIDLLAAGEESRVTGNDGKVWQRRIAHGVVPAGNPSIGIVHLDATVESEAPEFLKALNIQQAAQKGFAFARAAAATSTTATDTFPQLEIRWVPGAAVASGYTATTTTAAARATISDDPQNPDAYDDDIVLREYGQHVLASIAAFPSGPAPHQWNTAVSNETIAFLDGYSFWFACAVQGRATFIDTIGPSSVKAVFDLELQLPAVVVTPPVPAPSGTLVPGAVAASLWDLVDDASEARDSFAGTLPAAGHDVLLSLDQRKGADSLPSTAAAWTSTSFVGQFGAGGTTANREAAARVFIHYGTLVDDKSEPNDLAGEPTAFGAVPSNKPGLVLNQFNEDRFSFDVGAQPLSVAASLADSTGVELTILDATGVVIATASNLPLLKSPVVAVTPADLPPGTYVARVAWKSGPATQYTLGIASRPALVNTSLPEWTEGEAFNVVLTVTGGLAPVTFTIKPAVPDGLTLINPDGRLTGRPTTPGVFDLVIVASDASGAGPQVAGTLQLKVNKALAVSDVFGVPANQTIGVDLGTGGTQAQWTPDALSEAGLTLTGGPTLHLAGSSGAPREVNVSGSATDFVNASLPSTTSHVVVSAPIGAARGSQVVAGGRFGFWFDALALGRASFDFAFSGRGKLPTLKAVVDAAGAKLDLTGVVQKSGGHTKVTNLVLPRTSRYFLIFEAVDATSVTQANSRVRPATHFSGVANIATTGTKVEGRFTAMAGSRIRVILESGAAPIAAKPDFLEIVAPVAGTLDLPAGSVTQGGRKKVVSGITLPDTGEYVLRVGGNGSTTGPLLFEIEITPPKNAALVLN